MTIPSQLSSAARRSKLMSGDDKFMTRWVVKRGWKMRMQLSPECTLATTFKPDGKFFKQILRWTRNTWRSDFKSLVLERHIWFRFPVQARAPDFLSRVLSLSPLQVISEFACFF
jgi:hypothetical protein